MHLVRLEYAALYAGLNLLILVGLSAVVVGRRMTHQITLGDGGNKAAERAIRAHANASEYIPAGLVGILILALMDPAAPAWAMHAAGISLTLGRVMHGIGLNLGTLNWGRQGGMMLTYASYVITALALIGAAFAGQF